MNFPSSPWQISILWFCIHQHILYQVRLSSLCWTCQKARWENWGEVSQNEEKEQIKKRRVNTIIHCGLICFFWLFFSLDNFFTEIILSRQIRLSLNEGLEIWDLPLYKIILSRELFIKPRAIWSPHNSITPFWQTATNHYILELTVAWL